MASPWHLTPGKKTSMEVAAAFGAGSLLDLDHFLTAGSLRLKVYTVVAHVGALQDKHVVLKL